GDARVLLPKIPDESLSRLFLLYPDPWHKQRHKKRRFVNVESIGQFHRMLKPGGVFRFASDIEDYVYWVVKNIDGHGGFKYAGKTISDWRQAPQDWHQTRYEQKAIREGRTPAYISFERI
ncbi:MAG TPA: tRNA (guanosine(46)-N7)-methyltransferase TrmB, partial [Rhizobiales bacterium]|nr:tRNA (guanosine(46)-N7)-methyltransferase TrmB [Hyphomicrobiales bacterium]